MRGTRLQPYAFPQNNGFSESIKNSPEFRHAASAWFTTYAAENGPGHYTSGGSDILFDTRYFTPYFSDLSNALGGAHFGIITGTLIVHSGGWAFSGVFFQNDPYTFAPTGRFDYRLWGESYSAGRRLEMSGAAQPFFHQESWTDSFSSY